MLLWKFYMEKRARSLGMLPWCWCVPVFLHWGTGEMPLRSCGISQTVLGASPCLRAMGWMLSGLLGVGMLLSVTHNPSALQSCWLSRLKERNFFFCLV